MMPGERTCKGHHHHHAPDGGGEGILKTHRAREVLEKYCGYMSVPIILNDLEDIKERKADS